MNAFLDEMHRLLEDINKLKLHTYLIGDFNINTLRSHTGLSKTATEFSNLLLSYFYYPLINKPTRVVNDSSSLIDNMYTNIAQCGDICSTGVLTTDFIDHYSIFAITNFNLCKVTPAIIRKCKFSNKSEYKFHSALKKLGTWDGIYNAENINCAFQYFQDTFIRLFETYFPLVNVKITYSNKLPWITNGLRESVKKKSQLRSIMEKDPSKGLGIITKARKCLNRETLLKLYNAFVFPYLTYCVEVWGTAPKKYLDPLIKIQKKIVRIITFSPYLCHTDPIFKDLNLLPISKLVTQRIGLLTHILRCTTSVDLSNLRLCASYDFR